MNSSESRNKISAALVKAQAEMGAVKKGAANPFFKSKYADLTSIIQVVMPVLNKHGISITQSQSIVQLGGSSMPVVSTNLMHESGEYISSMTPIVVAKQNDPQALGSAISYARRYGLQSLVCLPAEDDDAEKAMIRNKGSKSVAKKGDF